MASANILDPIPHPPKKPLVGNMLSINPGAPMRSLLELEKDLGPIFWLDMRGYPVIFVSSFDLVDELCDEKRFDKTVKGALKRVRPFAGDGLFTADTNQPNWGKAHNILMQPFGNRAMRTYHPMMVDIARQLIMKWERMNGEDEIDVVHDMTALTLDTIGLCGFDYRFNSFYRRDYHPYVEAMVRSLDTAMHQRGLPFENIIMRGRMKTMDEDVAFMNEMVDRIVADRREKSTADASQKDLLGAMMTGVDRATGTQLDDVNIRYQINTFLIAGHETTSGLLSYSLYAMLKNPEVLRKAYEEADRVLGADIDAFPTYEQVNQLQYITQILKEALRLWPPAPAFSLSPYKDEVIGGKYRIRKGSFVNILVSALHRDPTVWGPRAELFDPENFAPEAEAKRPANAWKPFGNGQRACIGRGFAMHESALALGMILQRFKLIDHMRYQLETKETLTIKPEGFKIKVRAREDRGRGNAPQQTAPVAMQASAAAGAPRATTRPGHNTPLLVLYGSNLGTAEDLAHRLAETAEVNGFSTTLAPLDDHVGTLPKEGALVVFCASYNGAPPDNAAKFVEWLKGDVASDAAKGVRYTVFGCGNREWAATYQSVPRMIDERLAAIGATRVFDRGEGDARDDLDSQFERWFAALGPAAAKAFGLEAAFNRDAASEPLYAVETVSAAYANPVVAAAGARSVRVVENRELQTKDGAMPSDRSTRHIEVALPEGATYRVGDHLSIVPQNDSVLVAAIARRFGLTTDTTLKLRATEGRRAQLPVGEVVSVGTLLGQFLEVQQVATRKHIQAMAAQTRCPMTKPKLEALAEEEGDLYRTEVFEKRKSVYDLLEEFPACELSFPTYLEQVSLLAPRYYSISSSPSGDPQRCSVTVGVVEGPARSGRGTYKGVCSNWVFGARPGDTLYASVKETKAGFRLPDDNAVPIVMIGPGTGLAPFRGFLEERAARRTAGATLGPAMLFFGCRRPDQDFLYADELKRFASDGVSELRVAFSRGEGPKTYVQDLLRQEADAVWPMIEAGGIVYVCGDGGRMEPDVKRALCEMHGAKTGADAAASQAWIEQMGRDNRYVLDVWSGG